MRVRICAVGRLRDGPEKTLIDEYLKRFDRTGRPFGVGPSEVVEVEDRKGKGMRSEASLLTKAVPKGSVLCVLDERGQVLTSPEFAFLLQKWCDTGHNHAAFVIGGADGVSPELRANADFKLSLGAMVWPHMLARVMLTEQLYRAASILAKSPYHRL